MRHIRGLTALVLFTSWLSACAPSPAEHGIEEMRSPLLLTSARWPASGGSTNIPVCLTAASFTMPNFNVVSSQLYWAVQNSWPLTANINFTGWGQCPANTTGVVAIDLQNNTAATTSRVLGDPTTTTPTMKLGIQRGDIGGDLGPHEFGHVLGFQHENYRRDFTDEEPECSGDDTIPLSANNTLGTPPDRWSIMSGTGYCSQRGGILSFWDRRGVRSVYGNRTHLVLDPSMDGDQFADLIIYQSATNAVFVGRSNGANAIVPVARSIHLPGLWLKSNDFGTNSGNVYVGDFDGDQIMDLGYLETNFTPPHFLTSLSTGLTGGAPGSNWWSSGIGSSADAFYVGDFNGDGRDDLGFFRQSDHTFQVATSTGSGLNAATQWIGQNLFGSVGSRFFPGDYNGDGITDLGYQETSDNTFHVALSTGAAPFRTSTRWIGPNVFGNANGRYYVGDFNADGKDDLGFFEPTTQQFFVALSTAAGFQTGTAWNSPGALGSNKDNFFPADYNGDRRVDLAYRETADDSFWVSLSTGSNFASGTRWIAPRTFGSSADTFFVTSTRRRR